MEFRLSAIFKTWPSAKILKSVLRTFVILQAYSRTCHTLRGTTRHSPLAASDIAPLLRQLFHPRPSPPLSYSSAVPPAGSAGHDGDQCGRDRRSGGLL